MLPLTMASPGEALTIQKIAGRDAARQHLAELGFVADRDATVVSRIAGNVILQVQGSRVALDPPLASRIMICMKGADNENIERRKGR